MRQKNFRLLICSSLLIALLAACSVFDKNDSPEALPNEEEIPMSMILTSTAFVDGGLIPARHARRGENLSPPLAWSGAPDGTLSFALIVDDPDAPGGDWVHWLVYNLPADLSGLPEGVTTPPGSAAQGKNGWGAAQYDGPQPPSGTHRYVFKLYALDAVLDLGPGATKAALLDAIDGHVLARAQLIGKYSK